MNSCTKDAQKLRDRFRSLAEQSGEAFKQSQNPTNTAAKDRLSALADAFTELKKEWDALRAKCLKQGVDIGALDGKDPPTRVSDKSDEQRKQEEKPEYRRMADTMDFYAGEGKVMYVIGASVFVVATVLGGELEAGGEAVGEAEDLLGEVADLAHTGAEVDHSYSAWFEARENYEAMVTGWQEGAEGWRDAAVDPASPDFSQIVEPKLAKPVSPPHNSGPRHFLLESLTARRNANAYVQAYVRSYERYQGAEAARDLKAMSLQRDVMERYAKSALAEARSASAKQYAFDNALAADLEQLQSKMTARNLTWDRALSAYREKYGRDGLSTNAMQRIAASHWPESKTAELRRMIGELGHDKIRRALSVLQARVQHGTPSAFAFPEPPDISGLETLLSAAALRASLSQPASPRPNSSPTGAQGQLVIAFPAGVNLSGTTTRVFQPGGQKPVAFGLGSQSFVLSPGTYEVEIAKRRLTGVTVQAGQNTQLKVGVLRVTADSQTTYDVLEPTEGRKLAGGFGSQNIGLPVGDYHLRIRGKVQPITIEEGKITDIR